MLYKKIIELTLQVEDPTNFCSNIRKHAILAIESEYIGKCYQGVYIMGIDEIIAISSCTIVRTNNSGHGYIHVRFRAEVSLLSKWDIITGIKLIKRDKILLGEKSGKTPAVVNIISTRSEEVVQIGQIISGRVKCVEYGPLNSSPAVVALMLTCDLDAPNYHIIDSLSFDNAVSLVPYVLLIKNAMLIRKEEDFDRINFFEKLLYSYLPADGAPMPLVANAKEKITVTTYTTSIQNEKYNWVGPVENPSISKPKEIINLLQIIMDFSEGKVYDLTGYWSRPLNIYRSSPIAINTKEVPAGGCLIEPCLSVIAQMLTSIYNFINAINEMVYIYSTDESIIKHENIWDVMKLVQITS